MPRGAGEGRAQSPRTPQIGPTSQLRSHFQRLRENTKEAAMHLSRLARSSALSLILMTSLSLSACGYSQEEWDQKLRENEKLATDLKTQREATRKAQADNAEAVKEIEDLKRQLTERGINLENANASIAEQRKALEEYGRRTEQLDAIRKRFEL